VTIRAWFTTMAGRLREGLCPDLRDLRQQLWHAQQATLLGGIKEGELRERAERAETERDEALTKLARRTVLPEGVAAVVECLRDDAASLRGKNPECEIADNMDRAADLFEARSLTMTVAHFRDAIQFVNADTEDDSETEITFAYIEAGVDEDGDAFEAGLVVYYTDYPEEGCIPLSGPKEPTA
jgi:hypothetical protein